MSNQHVDELVAIKKINAVKNFNAVTKCYIHQQCTVEIVPEQFQILFRPGTTPLRSGLGTFYIPVPDQAKHFLLDVELIIIIN